MRRLRCYLAAPISKGDLYHNIVQANDASKQLAEAGFAPWNPVLSVYSGGVAKGHSVFSTANRGGCGLTHDEWLEIDLCWVKQADAILRLPGESVGADLECETAFEMGIPVFERMDDLLKWRDSLPKDHPDRVAVTTPRRLRCIADVLESRIDDHLETGCAVRPLHETFDGVTTAYEADLDFNLADSEPIPFSIPDGVP